MKIYSVFDEEFKNYGQVIEGLDTAELCEKMKEIPMPEESTAYEPAIEKLEACAIYKPFKDSVYGGMPIQIGMCWGHNMILEVEEYHRDSEINLGTSDFIALLGLRSDIVDGKVDASKIKAFRIPAGIAVEYYATALHYAPCQTDMKEGFRVAVVLPKGTNTDKPEYKAINKEDALLTARNKWIVELTGGPVVLTESDIA